MSAAYDVLDGSTASTTNNYLQVTVGSGSIGSPQGTAAGDMVWVVARGSSNLPTGGIDSQGHVYTVQVDNGSNANSVAILTTMTTKPLVAGTDWIKISYASNSGAKSFIARACTGVASATADKTANNANPSGSPASGYTPTLDSAPQLAVGGLANTSTGGAPTSPSWGNLETILQGSYLSEIDAIFTTDAAVEAAATTSGSVWAAVVATFPLTVPPEGRQQPAAMPHRRRRPGAVQPQPAPAATPLQPVAPEGTDQPAATPHRRTRQGVSQIQPPEPPPLATLAPEGIDQPSVTPHRRKRQGTVQSQRGNPPVLAYLIGTATEASGSSVLDVPVTTAPGPGDAIFIAGGGSGAVLATGTTDTVGNTYVVAATESVAGDPTSSFADCLQPALLAAGDTIAVAYSANAGSKNAVAVGIPGAGAVDSGAVAAASGTSGTPSVTSGQLAGPGEVVLGVVSYGNQGGATIGYASGWVPLCAPFRTGTQEWTAVAFYVATAATPVTLSATIAGTPGWSAVILPIRIGAIPELVTAPQNPVRRLADLFYRRRGKVQALTGTPYTAPPPPVPVIAPGEPVTAPHRRARRGTVQGTAVPVIQPPVLPSAGGQPAASPPGRKRRRGVISNAAVPVIPPFVPPQGAQQPSTMPHRRTRPGVTETRRTPLASVPAVSLGRPVARTLRKVRAGVMAGARAPLASVPARTLGHPVARTLRKMRAGAVTAGLRTGVVTAKTKTLDRPVTEPVSLLRRLRRGVTMSGRPAAINNSGVQVVGSWTASRAITSTSLVPGASTIGSVDCEVAPADGNWLIAYATQTQLAAYAGSTLGVCDDVHGHWIPLGIPNGTSALSGLTTCAIWARPGGGPDNPVPGGSHVYVYPTGEPGPIYPAAIGVTVIEVEGMSPYAGIPAVATASLADADSITADPGTPTSQALLLAVAASDNAQLPASAGPGWEVLPGVGIDEGSPVIHWTSVGWQVSTGDATAAWTVTEGSDLSCCVAMILVSNTGPAQPNPNWPVTQLQFGFGSGASTPPDQITWTDMTSRLNGDADLTVTYGQPYELGQPQAGSVTLTMDNKDGFLDPENTAPANPWAGLMVADTPVRMLMTWLGRTYSVFNQYVSRIPQAWTSDTRRGVAQIQLADAWSLLTNQLNSCQQEEMLTRAPYALWACDDASGATAAQNAAPGNSNTLLMIESKGGAGSATAGFGQNSGVNPGDPDATTWAQTGLTNGSLGYCLLCQDDNYPTLADGITIMGWFNPENPSSGAQPAGLNLYLAKGSNNATGDAFALFLGNRSGYDTGGIYFRTYDRVTRQPTDTPVNITYDWEEGGNTHITILLTQTTWEVIIDAGAFTGASGTCNLPADLQWLTFLGSADRWYTGGMCNAGVQDIGVYPGLLPQDAINQIVVAGYPTTIGGQFPEDPNLRIERLAGYTGWAGPRAISTQSSTLMAPISDIQGQSGSISASGVITQGGGQAGSQAITNIVTSDSGWCNVDGNGVLCYLSRGDQYGRGPMWLLGELVDDGEYSYLADVTIANDKTKLYNVAQLTPSIGSGTPVNAQDSASVNQHSAVIYTATAYQDDIDQIEDQANWIVNTRGEPSNHAEQATVDAGPNAANWPFVLGVNPADPCQLIRRPITASEPVGPVQAVACQVVKTFNFGAGKASAKVVTDSFPEGNVLTVGDPVKGQLDGTHPLAW
jgi:hypothetical protein